MFAKEIFDYPELEEHPLLCNHLGKKKLTCHLQALKHLNKGASLLDKILKKKLLSYCVFHHLLSRGKKPVQI